IPAGYASHTGYQYDSISRVAGQRELAPPSKFSKDGGFRNNVFKGMSVLVSYINILYRALKPRESKRLQAAGQWSISALGGVGVGFCRLGFRSFADGRQPLLLLSPRVGAQAGLAPVLRK